MNRDARDNHIVIDRVVAAIERYRMFEPGHRVGVAVSGGADSVCLLHVLRELAPRWNLKLAVLHVDHQLRGEESRADAEFVRDLAAGLGLPFHLRQAVLADDNVEQAARNARREFFAEFLNAGRLDRVALGHTRSDQAETVLFRLLRGAGTAGLSGIHPRTSDGYCRPLIHIVRRDVELYLREHGISWREDATNADPAFARNRIRHDLLPSLTREWNPAISEVLANTADFAFEEEIWWDAEISRIEPDILQLRPPAVFLRAADLHRLPRAVARRVARRAVERARGDLRAIGFAHIELILGLAAMAEGSGRAQIPGLDVYRSFDWMRIAPPGLDSLDTRNFRMPFPVPSRREIPGLGIVIIGEVVAESGYNNGLEGLDPHRISAPLELRNWRPGDRYRPLGYAGEEKLKGLFQQARIPLWERRHWPVVTCGDSIVWARRFGIAADFAACPGTCTVYRILEAPIRGI